MKKILLVLIMPLLALTSCDKYNCDPARSSGSFEDNKTIVLRYNEHFQQYLHYVEEGENLVFRYSHSAAQCDDIMDDEWGYNLSFEVDKDATHFRFEGAELSGATGFYREFGVWVGSETYTLQSGKIEGTRIAAGKWRVKADVTVLPERTIGSHERITFDTVFKK